MKFKVGDYVRIIKDSDKNKKTHNSEAYKKFIGQVVRIKEANKRKAVINNLRLKSGVR